MAYSILQTPAVFSSVRPASCTVCKVQDRLHQKLDTCPTMSNLPPLPRLKLKRLTPSLGDDLRHRHHPPPIYQVATGRSGEKRPILQAVHLPSEELGQFRQLDPQTEERFTKRHNLSAIQNLSDANLQTRKRRRTRRHGQGDILLCDICGEKASNHSYYGAQACISCRAFFRRSVYTLCYKYYYCYRTRNCDVKLRNRKVRGEERYDSRN